MTTRLAFTLVAVLAAGCTSGGGTDEPAAAEPSSPSPSPSSGSGLIEIPDVVGMNPDDAVRTLEESGFDVQVAAAGAPPNEERAGRVGRQEPFGGTDALDGRTVTVFVFGEFEEEEVDFTLNQERDIFANFFEETPPVRLLESMRDVESVDKVVFRADDDTIEIAVTSRWASADNQREGAWAIGRALGQAYWSGSAEWMDDLTLSLDLTVSSHRYRCDHNIMSDVGQTRASRADWESACS